MSTEQLRPSQMVEALFLEVIERDRRAINRDLVAQWLRDLADRMRIAEALTAQPAEAGVTVKERKGFPILGSGGQTIDFALVADHGKQAQSNHYQTVERLAARGGLSWCELYAVLHNQPWKKMDENEAIVACRALEAKYLSALHPTPAPQGMERAVARAHITLEDDGAYAELEVLDGTLLQPEMSPVNLYATPQPAPSGVNAEMLAAFKPFAAISETIPSSAWGDDLVHFHVTVNQLRAAHSALAALKSGGEK